MSERVTQRITEPILILHQQVFTPQHLQPEQPAGLHPWYGRKSVLYAMASLGLILLLGTYYLAIAETKDEVDNIIGPATDEILRIAKTTISILVSI